MAMKMQQMTSRAPHTLFFASIVFLASATSAIAQEPAEQPSLQAREDFSDNELKSFVKASRKITSIQMETEQKMVQAIENEGLTVDRFHQILEHQRNPDSSATETSPNELKSFNNAAQVIIQENKKVEEQMNASIEEEGIDVQTYNQIMVAYQQNAGIQRRVDQMISQEQ